MRTMQRHYLEEAMIYLEVAKSVFPMTEDKESISIEDILNGKIPKVL